MKLIFSSILLFFLASNSFGQTENPQLDTTLAKQLGADEYGMKMYVFVVLKSGENKTTDKHFIDSCFTGHLANITRLAETKQLVVAGPFGKNQSDFRGLFILNTASLDAAQLLLQSDPAIDSKLLKAELYPWYGSAALPEYLPFHDKIWKKNP